jgi:acyl-coenzyme A thioesterase 9
MQVLRHGRLLTSACSQTRSLCAAGRHQTPIVDHLWKKRAEIRKQNDAPSPENTPGERQLISKAPQDSANSITYTFSSDEDLSDQYRNPWGNVRVGRLLEDLDALAGTVAFEHCQSPGEPPLLLVTASVDRIVYRHRPNLKDDIIVTGRPNWVGRSSMEIGIIACATWTDEPFLEASFTFVARDPATNRPASINPLKCAAGEEAARFELGQARDTARKALRKRAKESLFGHALDAETTASAHELLGRSKRLLSMPALADPGEILLSETRLQNALIAQPQQRNTAGRVFGGFLMRRAFELAHTTAYLFAGRRPIFLELDEVKFASPVSVGDLVKLESCVLFTSEVMDIQSRLTVHVEVLAQVIQPEKRSSVTSNVFNFTFGVAQNADGSGRSAKRGEEGGPELRRVLPATHEESYRIMERYKADLAQRAEDEAAARGATRVGAD